MRWRLPGRPYLRCHAGNADLSNLERHGYSCRCSNARTESLRMALKICIDCSPLLVRSAGVKTYLHHWLRALRSCDRESIATFLEPRDAHLQHTAGQSRNFLRLATLWALNRMGTRFVSKFVPECSVFHASNLLRRLPRGPKLSATVHDLTSWV